MIREGHEIKMRSEEGLILEGTVLDFHTDEYGENFAVVTNEGDEFDFVADGDEWKRKGVCWHVVKSNPCAPCIGLNPIAYSHLPSQEQTKLHGLMETSQRARVQLMDAEIRGDRRGADRWRSELRDVERKLTAAEQQHGPAFRNPIGGGFTEHAASRSGDEVKEYALKRWGSLSWRGSEDRDITWVEFARRIRATEDPGALEAAKALGKVGGLVRGFKVSLNPRKKRKQSRKKQNPKQRATNVRSLVARALK